MVFSSPLFLFLFLPLVLLGYYLLDRRFRNYYLLLASLLFYAWGEPSFVYVMIASVMVNYGAALLVHRFDTKGQRGAAKAVLGLDVLFNLSFFFVYKYLNFTTSNLVLLLRALGRSGSRVPLTHIALPIGISFFTFQAMSYVFDVYYHKGEVQRNPLNVMLYVSFFPQLIAGPIVRYQTVADEIRTRQETVDDFVKGVQRFLTGLAKKAILANTIAIAADAAFKALGDGSLTVGYSWLGAAAYTMQIFFDFSGYSDMAIGLGLMFGFHFLENFDHPYLSGTVSEFWRRWHISLGSWFRDYVYIPLGGSRVTRGRLVLNLFAVWSLTGIWHGANWTFICWGLMYFALLTMEKLTGIDKKLKKSRAAAALYRVFTLLCVVCGWVIFRAESLTDGVRYLAAMFGSAPGGVWSRLTGAMYGEYTVLMLICVLVCLDWKRMLSGRPARFAARRPQLTFWVKWIILAVLTVVSVSFTVISTYNPFIYFNF